MSCSWSMLAKGLHRAVRTIADLPLPAACRPAELLHRAWLSDTAPHTIHSNALHKHKHSCAFATRSAVRYSPHTHHNTDALHAVRAPVPHALPPPRHHHRLHGNASRAILCEWRCLSRRARHHTGKQHLDRPRFVQFRVYNPDMPKRAARLIGLGAVTMLT